MHKNTQYQGYFIIYLCHFFSYLQCTILLYRRNIIKTVLKLVNVIGKFSNPSKTDFFTKQQNFANSQKLFFASFENRYVRPIKMVFVLTYCLIFFIASESSGVIQWATRIVKGTTRVIMIDSKKKRSCNNNISCFHCRLTYYEARLFEPRVVSKPLSLVWSQE